MLPSHAPYAVGLMQQLGAPPSLNNLRGVVAGIHQLLPTIQEIATLSEEECSDELTVGTEAIRELLENRRSMCPTQWSTPSARRTDPMHGVITEYQVYVLAAYAPLGTPPAPFLQLLAQTLLAALRLQGARRSGTRGPGTTIDHGTAGARLLARNPGIVQTLPAKLASTQAYPQAVTDALESLTGPGVKYLEHAQHLLQLSQGDNDLPPSVGYNAVALDSDGASNVAIRQYVSYPSARIREARRSGLALAELADEDEFFTFGKAVGDPVVAADVSVAQLVLKRRYQLVQLERAAQLLAVGWSRFTMSETAQVLRALHRLSFGSTAFDEGGEAPDTVDIAAGAVLATMFWMARSPEHALTLQIYRTRADLPQTIQLRRLAYVLESEEWCVPAIRPRAAPRFHEVDRAAAHPAGTVVFLPAPSSAARVLRRLPACEQAQRQGSAFAFTGDLGPVQNRLQLLWEELRASSRGQITPRSIAEHIFYCVVDATRDVALASMVFERAHALGDTQLHYASFHTSMLARVYVDTTRRLQDATFAETQRMYPESAEHPDTWRGAAPPSSPADTTPSSPSPPSRVGSPICPTPHAVQTLASAVRNAVANATRFENSMAVITEVHNRLNLYVSLMMKYTLGLRDVVGPTPQWNHVDLADKAILLSDKDDAASFSTRVLPLPDVVVSQLLRLREHLQAMIPSLVLRAPLIATQISGALRGDSASTLPITFQLVERSGKVEVHAVSGSLMSKLVAEHARSFTLPGNANRHFLRSTLVDKGCPAIAVDYLLGHWRRGGEPLGRFATLDLDHYFGVLREHLQAIALEAGWRALPGLN